MAGDLELNDFSGPFQLEAIVDDSKLVNMVKLYFSVFIVRNSFTMNCLSLTILHKYNGDSLFDMKD